MNIERLSLEAGVSKARGVIVVIDVFRAFTCEPLMYHLGARRVFLEADINRCRETRGDALLVGEHNELPLDGFDFTNSPSHIMHAGSAVFGGRDVIHRTTSGVSGAVTALGRSDTVLLASYATAHMTAAFIRALDPPQVSIVAMGIRSQASAPEDESCGDYIEHLLTGTPYDHLAALDTILSHETARKFLRGDKPHLPAADPAICLQRDIFPFTLRAERRDDRIEAVRVTP
jgi:2-phosphosulfolactate phosphatase